VSKQCGRTMTSRGRQEELATGDLEAMRRRHDSRASNRVTTDRQTTFCFVGAALTAKQVRRLSKGTAAEAITARHGER
jgi:hypothetical protein